MFLTSVLFLDSKSWSAKKKEDPRGPGTTTTTTTTTTSRPPPRAYTLLKDRIEYKFPEEAASNSSNVNVAIAAQTYEAWVKVAISQGRYVLIYWNIMSLREPKGREVRGRVYRRRISNDLEEEMKRSRDRNLRSSRRGVEEECKGS